MRADLCESQRARINSHFIPLPDKLKPLVDRSRLTTDHKALSRGQRGRVGRLALKSSIDIQFQLRAAFNGHKVLPATNRVRVARKTICPQSVAMVRRIAMQKSD